MSFIERQGHLDNLRLTFEENHGRLPADIITSYLGISRNIERDILLNLEQKPTEIKKNLKRIQRNSQNSLNPAELTTDFCPSVTATPFQDLAIQDLSMMRMPSVVFWTDLTQGSIMMISILSSGARGTLTSSMGEVFTIATNDIKVDYEELPMSEEELAQEFTWGTMPMMRRFEKVMAEDPRGFKLADEFIKLMKEESAKAPEQRLRSPLVPDAEMPEFIIRGAEITANVYKRVYPIARKIKSS